MHRNAQHEGTSVSKAVVPDLGLVVAGHGRHYIVETPEGRRLTCHPRGKKSA
ncbi:MAG: ribosome small subunit-dependent GTPase A, partial [Bacteriovorax sp.]|nr:ribosome small subunit-dependent GTPase A [Rhizobacter sp.]